MKYKWMSLSCVVVMFALVSTGGAQAPCEVIPPVKTCQGRVLCPFGICGFIPCGCHGQLGCDTFFTLGDHPRPVCDPDHQVNGLLCAYSKVSAEPTTNSTVIVPTQNPDEPLWGWADVHEHQFANLAFGGAIFWGSVFDERGVNAALARGDYTSDFAVRTPSLGSTITLPVPRYNNVVGGDWGFPIHGSIFSFAFPNQLLLDLAPSYPAFIPTQVIYGFMNNIASLGSPFVFHQPGGIGLFDGWPTSENGGHQQMYYKWLERAYEGGMRLMVVHVVNNEVLCKVSFQREKFGKCRDSGAVCSTSLECNLSVLEPCLLCNDMLTAERQIDAIYDLEAFIDGQCGGADCGWYRIATSSQEAREIISGGKMAVVIGIEVDSLFDCKPDVTFCTEEYIRGRVDHYYDLGLRYVFPVHAFDNKFAGAALYSEIFAYANFLATGATFRTWDCSSKGINKKFITPLDVNNPLSLLYSALALLLKQPDFDQSQGAHCNAKGLTPEGKILLNVLIEKDMIIDIDHLSYRALEGFVNGFPAPGFPTGDQGQNECDDGSQCNPSDPNACQGIGDASCDVKGALEIFEDKNGERGYAYPVMSSHPSIMEDFKMCSENGNACTTNADCPAGQSCNRNLNVDNISDEYTHTVSRVKRIRDLGGIVALRAPGANGTTRRFGTGVDGVFGYNGIVDIMDGEDGEVPFYGEGHPGIAYTNDMGSFLKQTGPRHPSVDPEEPCLVYPFEAFDGNGVFSRQQTGDRVFDFNTDGLAHIGLMPDLLADVRTLAENGGVPVVDLDPLFNSAETFIRMWERIENCTPDTVAPTIDSLAVTPDRLLPPNQELVPVTITAMASDNCDPNPFCSLTAVTSSEPDGSPPDWQFIADVDVNNANLRLRAKRLGTGSGRVYTNEVTCSDDAGNMTTGTVEVFVPITPLVCTYSISPTSESFPASGGTGSVQVIANCSWTAKSNVSWITITSDTVGGGTSLVEYAVEANPDPGSRMGTLTITGGQILMVTQAGMSPAGAPTLQPNSVVNAASFRPATDPNGAIAPGTIVAIFGMDLANDIQLASLPTTLGDTSVTFDDIAAALFFVSGTQINAQVPFELMTGTGMVTVQVTRGSETSAAQPIGIAAVSPGIFTLNQQGTGAGAILHAEDFQPVSESAPARPGEFLLIFCTGLGPVQPQVESGDVGPSAPPLAETLSTPLVNIGGIPAPVAFSGLAPGFVGLYQVNVQVPGGVPSGTQDVEIIINNVPGNTVTLAVQ